MKEKKFETKGQEERALFREFQEDGLLPIDVLVLPECCQYIGEDHHGNEQWKGKVKIYCLIKRV